MRVSLFSVLTLSLLNSAVFAAEEPSPGPAPTAANVSYGPYAADVLDFWKAEGEGPRPLLVYIHGGGLDRW